MQMKFIKKLRKIKINMGKYKIKTVKTLILENIRYCVYSRFLFVFWIPGKEFIYKQDAINYCDKLNEKIN